MRGGWGGLLLVAFAEETQGTRGVDKAAYLLKTLSAHFTGLLPATRATERLSLQLNLAARLL